MAMHVLSKEHVIFCHVAIRSYSQLLKLEEHASKSFLMPIFTNCEKSYTMRMFRLAKKYCKHINRIFSIKK